MPPGQSDIKKERTRSVSLIRSVLHHILLSYNISSSFPDTLQDLLDLFFEFLSFRFSGLHENFVQAILSKKPVFCIGLEHPAQIVGGVEDLSFLILINRLKHPIQFIASVRSFTVINPLCNISCQEQRIFRCTEYTDTLQRKYYLLWLFIVEGSEDYSEPIYNFMIVISHVPPKNVRGNFQQSPRKAAWKIIPNRFTNYATRLYRRRVHIITIHTTDMIGSKGYKHFLHPLSR